jgi:hypothetical protein
MVELCAVGLVGLEPFEEVEGGVVGGLIRTVGDVVGGLERVGREPGWGGV